MKTNQSQKNISSGWPQVKLDDIGVFSKGTGISKEQLSEKGLNAVRYGELYTKHDFQIKKIYSFIDKEVALESKEIKQGDILFAGSGETIDEIGKSAAYMLNEKAYAGGDIIIFRPRNSNSLFLSYFLNVGEARKKLRELGQGQSVVHIYKSDIENLKLNLPPLPEQNRIVLVLETWDNAIEKLSKKIEVKKQIKKGLMQDLLTGKKRLKGFSDKWETVEFNDFFEVLKKPEGYKLEEYLPYGEIPVIDQSKDTLISGYVNNKEKVYDFTKKPVIIFGDHSRATKFIDMVVSFGNDGVKLFQTKNNFDVKFGYYVLLNFRIPETGYNRHFKYLDSAIFDIPKSKEEQVVIAKILTTSDNEIQELEKKLQIIKDQKKYLLNNLITGTIRTPENLLEKVK